MLEHLVLIGRQTNIASQEIRMMIDYGMRNPNNYPIKRPQDKPTGQCCQANCDRPYHPAAFRL